MTRALPVLFLVLAALQEAPPQLTAAEFAARRTRVLERLPDGALALDAGPLREVGSDDNTPVFDFRYLAGLHDDRGILVILKKKPHLFLEDPKRAEGLGIEDVFEVERFGAWASANLPEAGKIYTKLRQANLDRVKRAAPGAAIVGGPLSEELTNLRLRKSGLELRLMRKAADATNKAHVAAMKALRPRMNEKEIQKLVEGIFRSEGCPELGFRSICGAGRNGTILHYNANEQEVPPGTLMVCDIGAALENYVTDITRTLPTSGRFTDAQRVHYQCVLDAQKAAEALLKPGAGFRDLERAARGVFEERGLTKWSYAHSKDRSVRHGLGHYVGMSVHDSGTYSEKFEPGMVITIEPGWYDKDAGYGIRIEDIYVITPEGFDRISSGAPREIDEVEKLMAPRKEY